jgi:hypothetical protein
MVWSERDMSLKNPVTPPGIDPGTVRLVAQRRNHYATPGSREPSSGTNLKVLEKDYCTVQDILNVVLAEMHCGISQPTALKVSTVSANGKAAERRIV